MISLYGQSATIFLTNDYCVRIAFPPFNREVYAINVVDNTSDTVIKSVEYSLFQEEEPLCYSLKSKYRGNDAYFVDITVCGLHVIIKENGTGFDYEVYINDTVVDCFTVSREEQ